MRKGIQILLCGFIFLSFVAVSQRPDSETVAATVTIKKCRCGKKNCRGCRAQRCRKCPKCQNDACVLNAECVKEKRTCFEVEQKLICVPKISLPWRRCEKPCGGDCAANCRHRCGKTRTIKVLKSKTYECDVCKYSWKVFEPQDATVDDGQPTQPPLEPALENQDATQQPETPQFDNSELYDPAGGDVPKAPVMNDSASSALRKFRRR